MSDMKRNIFLQCFAVAALLLSAWPVQGQEVQNVQHEQNGKGVQIGGAVYGGGRSAKVAGSSHVYVYNADEIGAVYGGNDIADDVYGTGGATIQIGSNAETEAGKNIDGWTTKGTTTQRMHIGSVYGGGNGYYLYPTLSAGGKEFEVPAGGFELKYEVDGTEVFEEHMAEGSYTVPTIEKAKIDVYSEYAFIDSLFGGAKNAFIGVAQVAVGNGNYAARPTSTTITVHDGTIYSLFGGNNYGGEITNQIAITVENTHKQTELTSAGLGETHGIKYLFGGGNRVNADTVTIAVLGGQIDTAFAGGNAATVTAVRFSLAATETDPQRSAGLNQGNLIFGTRVDRTTNMTVFDDNEKVKDVVKEVGVPTVRTYPFNAVGGYRDANGRYLSVPEDKTNVYNIRALFGGNNQKEMACVPTLDLTSGGIGTLYGGGNAGAMRGKKVFRRGGTSTDTVVGTLVALTSPNVYVDYVYGGCQMADVDYSTYVLLQGANVGHVFGGNNISGDVGSFRVQRQTYPVNDVNGNTTASTVDLEHSAQTYVVIEQGARVFGNVFGGSNGYYHCPDGQGKYYVAGKQFSNRNYVADENTKLKLPTCNITHIIMKGGHVYQDIYAGGNMASVGFDTLYTFDAGDYSTAVGEVAPRKEDGITQLYLASAGNGTSGESRPFVLGSVYGGGNMASVFGVTDMIIDGSPIISGAVYGGNDKMGRVENNNSVALSDGHLKASDGTLLTNSNASVYLKVMGKPKITAVYGGGNGDYDYNQIGHMLCYTGEVDLPVQSSAFVDINIAKGGYIGEVYGGGNNVTVSDSVTVLINTYAAEGDNTPPDYDMIGTVYGGCNKADMNIVPNIQLKQGRVHDVYGGSNSGNMLALAPRGSNSNDVDDLILGVSTYVHLHSHRVSVSGTVYGGCTQGNVAGNTLVQLHAGKVETIFGGNNISGYVGGQTHVHIDDGEVTQVYGGSNGYYVYHPIVSGSTASGAPLYDTLVYPAGTSLDYDGEVTFSDGSTYTYENVTLLPGTIVLLPADPDDPLKPRVIGPDGKAITGASPSDYIVGTGGIPNCGDTYVKLHGGIVHNDVYGGGYAGTCHKTLVELKGTTLLSGAAPGAAPGAIYGGGRGDDHHLGFCVTEKYARLGAVTDSARVQLYSCHPDSKIGKVYGGGNAGDAKNTYVVLHPSFAHHFTHMYAGCKAADVAGKATMVLNGMVDDTHVIADTVYGGNDVAGHVNKTHLIINSGRYGAAFGGGDGDYHYSQYYKEYYKGVYNKTFDATTTEGAAAEAAWWESIQASCWDSIPSTQDIVFTINDRSLSGYDSTFFTGYVYGGGNMSLVGDRTIGSERWDETTGAFNANAAVSMDETRYGRIELNIHGGYFAKRVFTGARGKANYPYSLRPFFGLNAENDHAAGHKEGLQLVYGLKQVNMDGGKIMLSLHGGSEFINDGYPYECKGTNYKGTSSAGLHTTLRPSSIVNVVGGSISKSVYGGGFEGTIYGSVYVNIGKEAVDSSDVWIKQYGTATKGYISDNADENVSFAAFKPATGIDGSEFTTAAESNLVRSALYLQASVYAGSDWGDAGKKAVFSTPGVYGGETYLYVDGRGYVTSGNNDLGDNMLIADGLFGAGTSTEGGDVSRKVQLFNYGSHDCFVPGRALKTIQRADTVILDHAYISLSGSQDAYSAYPSQNYSICRVRNLMLRDDNLVAIESPAIYIDTVESLKHVMNAGGSTLANKDHAYYYNKGAAHSYDAAGYRLYAIDNNEVNDGNTLCNLPQGENCGIVNADGNRNVLIINNGTYLQVQGYRDDNLTDANYANDNTEYGPMLGYCYAASGDGLEANIFARDKRPETTGETNNGFWSLCHPLNVTGAVYAGDEELAYVNAQKSTTDLLKFRSWTIGSRDAGRTRAVTIVASQHPTDYKPYNAWLLSGVEGLQEGQWSDGTTTYDNYAIATAVMDLPPANAGSYYTLSDLTVDAENAGEVTLINAAWDSVSKQWILASNDGAQNGAGIEENPSFNFGLMFETVDNGYFAECTNTDDCKEKIVLAGTNHYSSTDPSVQSPAVVADAQGVLNQLKFRLTYNTKFNRGLIRNVSFTLNEHIPDGNGGFVESPIYVTVTLATIIDDFGVLKTKALAMYNGGIEHKYVRRVVLPAAYEERHVYLTGIKWSHASTECGNGHYLLVDTNHCNSASYTDINGDIHPNAKADAKTFSVTMRPSEDVANNTSTSGWYSVAGERTGGATTFDIRNLYDKKMVQSNQTVDATQALPTGAITLTDGEIPEDLSTVADKAALVSMIESGEPIGVLDGRATASLEFTSFYNGNLIYNKCDELGTVTLTFHYVATRSGSESNVGTFQVELLQWSREKGDTIYVASAMCDSNNSAGVGGVIRKAPNGDTVHLRGYDWERSRQNANRTELRGLKGKEPRLYLTSFQDALKPNEPYIEGDVIAIIDTMKLDDKRNVVIHGSDEGNNEYATIQIIRYSGTHYQLPGEHGAYRGPLMMLSDKAQLRMSNVWLNGSGLTRTKPSFDSQQPDRGTEREFNGKYYYEKSKWVADTLFVNDPMILVKDNASFTTVSNVRMSNAINQSNDRAGAKPEQLGAAITLMATTDNNGALLGTPKVTLGDNTRIFNNTVVNHSFYNSILTTADNVAPLPGNSGAAVHVNNGLLQMGDMKAGIKVLAEQNYYLWRAPNIASNMYYDSGNGKLFSNVEGTTEYYWDAEAKQWKSIGNTNEALETSNIVYTYPEIVLDNTAEVYKLALNTVAKTQFNNVSLKRTAVSGSIEDAREMKDNESNVIVLPTRLSADTKVGVSKWFPGGAPSYLRDIRDTIRFAIASSIDVALDAHGNGNFFADSLDYGVDTFYNTLVSNYNLYFHRCATFKFYEKDDISYHWDGNAYCPGGSDSLHVRLQEGFLPYTYTWHGYTTKQEETSGNFKVDESTKVEMRRKTTNDEVALMKDNANDQHAALIDKARRDTLLLTNIDMPGGVDVGRYYYTMTATDLAGCELKNNAMVKLVKTAGQFVDETNFLGRKVTNHENAIDWAVNADGTSYSLTTMDANHVLSSNLDSNFYHYRFKYKKNNSEEIRDTMLYRYNAADPALRNDTNKYLRFFKAYNLTAEVMPDPKYGTIYYKDVKAKEGEPKWNVLAGLLEPEDDNSDNVATAGTKVLLCPGDELELMTKSKQKGLTPVYDFMFWSFDPTAAATAVFSMPEHDALVAAYYAPTEYWYRVVTENPGQEHYEVDYRGNVHVKSNTGLAWLISTINGLNYQQAQTFVFDTIILEAQLYDMSAYRWTPLGNINHPFRGVVRSDVPGGSHIKGIYCDEHELPYVGFFGVLDGARIGNINNTASSAATEYRIKISDAYYSGNNYVGGLAAYASNNTQVHNVDLANIAINGENAVGGMFGYAANSAMKFNQVGKVVDESNSDQLVTYTLSDSELGNATVVSNDPSDETIYFLGASIYLGGLIGVAESIDDENNAVQPIVATDAQSLYVGGHIGQVRSPAAASSGFLRRLAGTKSAAPSSRIVNNYVSMQTSDESFRVGGLVGEANDVLLRNNYAYGNLKSWGTSSNLVAVVGENVVIEHCFYNSTLGGTSAIGVAQRTPQVSDTGSFSGIGNRVTMATPVEGLDNVTVLLNKYVREQGGDSLATWRSDLHNENNGLPLFGTPDTIPVYISLYEVACDNYEWQDSLYSESGILQHRSFDPVLLIDSLTTLHLTLNHSTAIAVSDSVALGDDYNGHGFRLTYSEIMQRLASVDMDEVQLLQFTDSLLTEYGCDSVVSLWLTVYKNDPVVDTIGIAEPATGDFVFDVQVYPNPTLGTLTVESEDLQQVEIYDNVSRKVMQSSATGSKHQMDLRRLSAGAYYVRVTTSKGVAVKKVIKK